MRTPISAHPRRHSFCKWSRTFYSRVHKSMLRTPASHKLACLLLTTKINVSEITEMAAVKPHTANFLSYDCLQLSAVTCGRELKVSVGISKVH